LKPKQSARFCACQTLTAVLSGESLNNCLQQHLGKAAPQEQPLARQLVYGALREWPHLSALLKALLRSPLKKRDRDIEVLLCLGLYQLAHTRIANHAAVSETVELTRVLNKSWASGLVNGILRRYQREMDALEAALPDHAALALPTWLADTLQTQWPNHVEQIASAWRSHPPMTLRINRQKTASEDYLSLLEEQEIPALLLADGAVRVDPPVDVARLPGFEQGMCSVQDLSAQYAGPLLNPLPNERILDACAAPGGKTGHILELEPSIALTAGDISPERLDRVADNLSRLGHQAHLVTLDASEPESSLESASFDAILADVPCSATGVIRRNPDVKLLRTPEDIVRFAAQQRQIVRGLWSLLKPGGRLLYVTCSILAEENDAVIKDALNTLPGAQLGQLTVVDAEQTETGWQRLPEQHSDGLFFALLKRSA